MDKKCGYGSYYFNSEELACLWNRQSKFSITYFAMKVNLRRWSVY